MKRVPIAEFKAHCSHYIEDLDEEGILITKHGKPVARVVADEPSPLRDVWEFYESLKGKCQITGDVFSTGREWDAQS